MYGPDDATCATVARASPGVALTLDGGQTSGTATSPPFTPAAAGTYRWRAFYSGDANNLPWTGRATPRTSRRPSPRARRRRNHRHRRSGLGHASDRDARVAERRARWAGQRQRDRDGRVNPDAGSTVEFRLYGPDDATCASVPVFTSTVAVSDAGTATSAPFTPRRAGTYRWRAFYSGDANNDPASGFCNAPGERVVVTLPDGPLILFAGFTTPPRVGTPARLVVSAVDLENPIAGVRVNFGEPSGSMGVSGCIAPTLALPASVVRQQVLYRFKRPGARVVTVTVLSGGCAGPQLRRTAVLAVTVAPRTGTRAAQDAAVPAVRDAALPDAGRAVVPAAGRAVVPAARRAVPAARRAVPAARRAVPAARRAVPAARRAAVPPAAPRVAAGCKNRALTPTAENRARVAAAVLCLVNVERRRRARKPLRRAPRLTIAAGTHATDMFRRVYFAHDKTARGPSLVTRLRRAGFRGPTYAENIGYASNGNATRIVAAWMNNPRNRANILHLRLKYAGVGIAAAIPDSPARPGATFTLDLGGSLR